MAHVECPVYGPLPSQLALSDTTAGNLVFDLQVQEDTTSKTRPIHNCPLQSRLYELALDPPKVGYTETLNCLRCGQNITFSRNK
jgi:hypothetical protein